ncbi:MAG: hypothetical protein NVS3B14_20430 [Ktedonobacteraceae bacterium]
MANDKEQQLQAFARRAARVSKALWPTSVRRSIATGRAAQTRRRLILNSRWWKWLPRFKPAERLAQTKPDWKSFPGQAHTPETPMPGESPLVRVLETFDLSQTNVEHFLDLPDGGNTGGYALKWQEEKTCS